MTPPGPMVQVTDAAVRYRNGTRVTGLDLRVAAGELVLLRGPSGAGKSTVLALVAGILKAEAGEVRVCGEDLTRLDDDGRSALRRRRLGVLLQQHESIAWLSSRQFVATAWGLPSERTLASADALLTELGIHGVTAGARMSELSVGQHQRVALARAVATRPEVLVLDEPTSSVDEATADLVWRVVAAETARGCAVIASSHGAAPNYLTTWTETSLGAQTHAG